MADANTVSLSEPHAPKEASIKAFKTALPEIKNLFHKLRKRWDEHQPQMFERVEGFTDHQLLEPIEMEKDLVQVRTGESAYGLHLFGKVRIHGVDDAFIHVRLFVVEEDVKVHCIQTLEKVDIDKPVGFVGIFTEADPLEWFNE